MKIKYIILTLILSISIINIDIVISTTYDTLIMFTKDIFVTVFPFIILSSILIYYDYHIFISHIFGNIISKLFNVSKSTSIVYILSLLTSSPNNSIYLNNLIRNNETNTKEASKILTSTFFPSISFTIGTIGIKIYNDYKIGLLLLFVNYLYNFIIAIYLRKYNYTSNTLIVSNSNKNTIFDTIKSSIIEAFKTCGLLLGNILIFTIIINIIKNYLNFNPIILSIISGLLEMTSGIYDISLLNIGLKYKIMLTSFILNFSSISILFQSKSIYRDCNIKKTLIIKLVFSILVSILLLLFI